MKVFNIFIIVFAFAMMLWSMFHLDTTATAAWAGFMIANIVGDMLDRQEKR